MARAVCLQRIRRLLLIFSLIIIATPPSPLRAAANPRIHFTPRFNVGQVFHYSVQMHVDSASRSSGPVADPEGPTKAGESINVFLRLEVLNVPGPPSLPGAARIRVTYETAAATSSSDSYDADTAAIAGQYKKLEGQSIEFTLEPTGEITDVSGLKGLLDDQSRSAIVNQWLSQLTLGASVPQKGIAIGEKWSSAQTINNVPLAGLAWRVESTYVRDEPCPAVRSEQAVGAVAKPVTPSNVPDQCAIIQTHSEITGAPAQKSSAHSSQQAGEKLPDPSVNESPNEDKDRTPEVFRKNGLRTFGEWTGSGDGLTAISLRTGMVVSVTQTAATHMDFTIMTTAARNKMRYAGNTRSQSQITLISQSPMP
ncbi:MAG TPA: hypothetical protein VJN90_13950 [Candidatus Acidoferrales bacterium]|nr:hypothetical protein [Candidatus Acidoferrales bacterium]